MPPKFKFTKEQIIDVSFSIARRQGIGAVTARAIGAELSSSPKVIFSLFCDMEEVKGEIKRAAKELYKSYIERGLSQEQSFKGVGLEYINFAKNEPKLFQLLFMQEGTCVPALQDALNILDNSYEKNLDSIKTNFGLSQETSKELYQHLWIYSHGIAVLVATKVCSFSQEQISNMLTEVFKGILSQYRAEGKL